MKRLICLLSLMLCVTGCVAWQNEAPRVDEAKATAILDTAEAPAKAHAAALADGTLEEAQETGLELLTVVSCWWRECGKD